MKRNWTELTNQAFADKKFLCMGIDPKFNPNWEHYSEAQRIDYLGELKKLCFKRIRAVGDIVGFIKPNWSFFVQYGWRGLQLLEELVNFTHRQFPNVAVILDMKVGDIGESNKGYVRAAFDELGGDAITIHPLLGQEANNPFLDRADKGIIILCHTSNPGAGEFQHLTLKGRALYLHVASNVQASWNKSGNCALVTGATFATAITQARSLAPTLPFLIPGIGKQGGDLKEAVKGGMRSDGQGFIINASSSIFEAVDVKTAALEHNEGILAAMI